MPKTCRQKFKTRGNGAAATTPERSLRSTPVAAEAATSAAAAALAETPPTRSAFVPALEPPRAEGCECLRHLPNKHRPQSVVVSRGLLLLCCAPSEVSQERLHTIFCNRRIDQLHLRVLSNFFAELAGFRTLTVARD